MGESLKNAASLEGADPARRLASTWFLVAVALFAACLLGIMTRPASSLAMVWPANALTLGLLLRASPDRRPAIWLSAPVAFVAADLVTGADPATALLLGAANLCGVAAAYAVTRLVPEGALKLREPQSVLWHVLVAAAGASAAGFFAAATNPFPLGLDRFGTWKFWFASELVNYVALLPLIMSAPPMRSLLPARPSFLSVLGWRTALPVAALIAASALAMYARGPGAIAFVVPALIWCGLTYPVFFVSLLAFAFASWSSTVIGGEYLRAFDDARSGGAIVSLRLAAFMIALAPIILSIVMRNRDELARKLSATLRRVDAALQAGGIVGTWDIETATDTMTIESTDPDARNALHRRKRTVETALANVHPDDRKRVRDELNAAIATGADFHCRYRDVAGADGVRRFAAFGKPVFDQRNSVSHLIGVFIDLTEQEKATAALALSDRRFNIVSESVPDIVWSTDASGRHDYFNRRWREFTGVAPGDIEPDTWTRLVHPDDERRVMEAWTASLRTGTAYSIDYRFRRHDGTYRWLRVQAEPVRDAQGAVVRWYGTSTDIDDAKQLEAEREVVAHELDHRIGNLFALVGGLVAMSVRDGDTAEALADAIRGRLKTLHDAHSLIRRGDDGGAVSLAGLLRTLLRPYDDGSGRVAIDGDDLQIAASAVTPVALVFHELTTNAVKHGALRGGKGRLRVTLTLRDDSLVIAWKEECQMPPSAGAGFGSTLFKAVVEGQLRGTATRSWSPQSLTIAITLPLPPLVGAGASRQR